MEPEVPKRAETPVEEPKEDEQVDEPDVAPVPVEEEAAVVDFTAELEGGSIKTKIKEKSEARHEYNDAITNNQTAVLLEETKQDIFE